MRQTLQILMLSFSACLSYVSPVNAQSLWAWDNARCFRRIVDPCPSDKTWVRDQQIPARCGCVGDGDYVSKEICDQGKIACDKDGPKTFSSLYDERDGHEIGCGCFETEE